MMDKKALRQEIRLRKRQFDGEQLRQLSLAVMQRLLAHPRVVQANTVMFYHSLPDEAYTHEAVDQLVKMGKRVLLPVVIDEQHLEIRQYQGPQDLKLGAMNILEPAGKPFHDLSRDRNHLGSRHEFRPSRQPTWSRKGLLRPFFGTSSASL